MRDRLGRMQQILEKLRDDMVDLAADSLSIDPELTRKLGTPTRMVADAADMVEVLKQEQKK